MNEHGPAHRRGARTRSPGVRVGGALLAVLSLLARCAPRAPQRDDASGPGEAGLTPPPAEPCPSERFESAPVAVPIGERTFGPDGTTAEFRVPAGAHFVAAALSGATRCAQVDTLRLDDGTALVEEGDFGLYCRRCRQRESVLLGAGLFAVPSDASTLSASRATLVLRNCGFGGSLRPLPANERVALSALEAAEHPMPRRGLLELTVVASPASWLGRATAARLRSLERDLARELGDAALSVRVRSRCVPAAAPGTLALEVGDGGPLLALERLARDACPARPEAPSGVVLWGVHCVDLHDATLGQHSAPDGYTTHVPGGFGGPGVADGIVVSDGCFGAPDGAEPPPPQVVRVLAHELGHYLGLYHSVERDGGADQLDDTAENNLLNAVPVLADARGLSPQQARVVRRHPSVRWPRAGYESCAEP